MAAPSAKRKPSGQVPTRFYDGPTVSKQARDAGNKAGQVASKAGKVVDAKLQKAKQTSQQVARSARRHAPRNHTFLNSFILALTLLSLLTLRFCPDTTPPSTAASRLNPFTRDAAVPAWERALCAPTQTYRRAILEPYIVPRVQKRVEQVRASNAWKAYGAPAVRDLDARVWRRYVAPVVRRTQRGAQSVYARTIRPRVPVVQRAVASLVKRVEVVLRPYTVKAMQQRDVLLARAQPYTSQVAAYRSKAEDLLSHPVVRTTRGHALDAYKRTSPVVQRYAAEGSRRWQRDVLPRARSLGLRAMDELERAYQGILYIAHDLYHAHLHHHVKPHLSKATTHTQSLFPAHLTERVQRGAPALFSLVMTPSLNDVRAAIRGGAESVSSSAQAVKEAVTATAGKKAADAKAYVNQAEEESYLERLAAKAKDVKDRVIPAAAAADTPASDGKITSKQIDATIDALLWRVAAEGKAQRRALDERIKGLVDTHRRKTVPTVLSQRISAIQERAEGIVKAHGEYLSGLETSVDAPEDEKRAERQRIEAISERTRESLKGLREGLLQELEEGLIVRQPVDASREEITRAVTAVLADVEEDLRGLGHDMTWSDVATQNDWERYQEIEKKARGFTNDYEAVLEHHMQPLLSLQSETTSEINTLIETYLIRVKTAEKNALHKLDGGVGILPVDLDGVRDAASGVIGKSKEQIQQAMAAAGVAVGASQGTASASSAISAGKASASSAARSVTSSGDGYVASASSAVREAASSASIAIVGTPSVEGYVASASSAIREAASSASSVVVGTPSAAGYAASASSILDAAASSVSSVVGGTTAAQGYVAAAQSAVQDAASSASSVVGGAPSPQSIGSSIASVASQASASAASIADQASSAYHSATRSAGKAVGATPSAESLGESIEDAISIASKSASSLAGDAASMVHKATRSASSYVGATPTPESLAEHVESISAAGTGAASTVVSVVKEGASSASSLAADATDKVKQVVRDEL